MAKGAGGVRYSHAKPSNDYKDFRAYSHDWKKTYFDNETGGYVVTEKDRIPKDKMADGKTKRPNDNEIKVFRKEQNMCKDLARTGHHIEHLNGEGKGKGNTYDIHFDGIPADLKSISSANNLARYVKHALKEQGAKIVIIRTEKHITGLHRMLKKLKERYDGRIMD
ncbi:MAG: hypothetical protein HUK14_06100 [Muribaculaceae bacterium]|nr:hypothetical protein [Muribaculaceae bacterium]